MHYPLSCRYVIQRLTWFTDVIVYLVRRLTAIACVNPAYCRCRLDTRQNFSYYPVKTPIHNSVFTEHRMLQQLKDVCCIFWTATKKIRLSKPIDSGLYISRAGGTKSSFGTFGTSSCLWNRCSHKVQILGTNEQQAVLCRNAAGVTV